jgi:hypothetical protein
MRCIGYRRGAKYCACRGDVHIAFCIAAKYYGWEKKIKTEVTIEVKREVK